MNRINKRIYIAAFIIYLIAVFVLCFIKGENLPEVEKFIFGLPMDKVAHFIMFLPFPILASLSIIRKEHGIGRSLLVLAILTITGSGIAYGTEVIQAQTGYRAYEIGDFVADAAGICIGCLATAAYIIIQKHRQ